MRPYDRISRYKAALMGIAILIVVYGHFFYYHSGMKDYTQLNITLWYTLGSVDIFLFLSGFGIYRSLKKNADPLQFMQRRMERLLPAYLPFILVYCTVMVLTDYMNKWQALGNLTTFGWWAQIGGQFNWYIPTLVGLYLFSPLFFAVLERDRRKALLVFPLLFLVEAGAVGTSLMIGLSRFPVYFLGMYLGAEAADGKQPSRRHLTISGVLMVGSMIALYFLVKRVPGWLSRYGFWWHPYLLSTPGCLYLTTWLMEKQEKWAVTRTINRGLAFLGTRSFEIYLCHIFVYTLGWYFGVRSWGGFLLLALGGIVLGCLYHKLVTMFTFWRKRTHAS